MKSLRLRALMTAIAVASTALVGVTATPAAAQASSFYETPWRLPSDNGAVIRTQAMSYNPGVSVEATKVLYKSTNATGEAIAVSGVVVVPTAPWEGDGPRPIVGHGPGTWGLADHCAVSVDFANRAEHVPQLLRQGYAVAATDYEGLGTEGVHTYAVGQAQGKAVLDAVRAAIDLGGSGISADSPVAVAGYSQGGQTALWAGELQPSYAPELSLVGIASGGAPGTLHPVAEASDGGPFFANIVHAGLGLDAAYDELDLENYLNWAGRYRFRQAREDLCARDFTPLVANKTKSDYMWRDPLAQPDWNERLWENSAGFRPMPVPMLFVHATDDQQVPYPQAEGLMKTYCVSGDGVVWSDPAGDHGAGAWEWRDLLIPFLADMFEGTPGATVPFTCGR